MMTYEYLKVEGEIHTVVCHTNNSMVEMCETPSGEFAEEIALALTYWNEASPQVTHERRLKLNGVLAARLREIEPYWTVNKP